MVLNFDNKYQYEVRGKRAYILRYSGTEQIVRVPSSLGGVPVEGIAVAAFRGNRHVAEITVAEGIRTIGEEAFADCKQLISVKLPDSLVLLGRGCFDGCGWLSRLTLPFLGLSRNETTCNSHISVLFGAREFVTAEVLKREHGKAEFAVFLPRLTYLEITSQDTLPRGAATGLNHLETVVLGRVNTVGAGAFENCKNLTSVTMSDDVVCVEADAFKNCRSLSSLRLSKELGSIGDCAFCGCGALIHVDFGSKLYSIGEKCFEKSGLVSVVLPASLMYLGAGAFSKCTRLRSFSLGSARKLTSVPSRIISGSAVVSLITGFVGKVWSRAALKGAAIKEITLNDQVLVYLEYLLDLCDGCPEAVFVDSSLLAAYKATYPNYSDIIFPMPEGNAPLLDLQSDDVAAPLLDGNE